MKVPPRLMGILDADRTLVGLVETLMTWPIWKLLGLMPGFMD